MKNQDEPAFVVYETNGGGNMELSSTGFTKREVVLKVFMAAMIAKNGAHYADDLSTYATMYVDDYFKELEK